MFRMRSTLRNKVGMDMNGAARCINLDGCATYPKCRSPVDSSRMRKRIPRSYPVPTVADQLLRQLVGQLE